MTPSCWPFSDGTTAPVLSSASRASAADAMVPPRRVELRDAQPVQLGLGRRARATPGGVPWRTRSTIDGETLIAKTPAPTPISTAPATIGRQPPPVRARATAATANSSRANTK